LAKFIDQKRFTPTVRNLPRWSLEFVPVSLSPYLPIWDRVHPWTSWGHCEEKDKVLTYWPIQGGH
jgi:hypothetical protein